MAGKTPIDKLSDAIEAILEEYADDIDGNVGAIAEAMGKKGVQVLRQESRRQFPKGSGEYAKGWKAQANRRRLSTTVTIYNEHYGLPHLLEHGHVVRNGTDRVYPSTIGREHIKPVADELVENFEQEVADKL